MNDRILYFVKKSQLVHSARREHLEEFLDLLFNDIISELDHYKFSVSENENENERFNEGFYLARDVIASTYDVKDV